MHAVRTSRASIVLATFLLATVLGVVQAPRSPAISTQTCGSNAGTLELTLQGDWWVALAFQGSDLVVSDFSGSSELCRFSASLISRVTVAGDGMGQVVAFEDAASPAWSALRGGIAVGFQPNPAPFDFGDRLPNAVYLAGSDGADTIAAKDFLRYSGMEILALDGGAGDDDLTGLSDVTNIFCGGLGSDRLVGGSRFDAFETGRSYVDDERCGSGDDTMLGGAGDDFFDQYLGGADAIDGGKGTDRIDYSSRIGDLTVVLGVRGAQTSGNGEIGENQRIANIENVFGGSGDDHIVGNGSANVLSPGPHGDDTLEGGAGIDTIDYSAQWEATGGLTIDLDANDDGVADDQTSVDDATSAIDVISGFENVIGTEFADTIEGSDGPNLLEGQGGADAVYGKGGDDRFLEGSDRQYVLPSNDLLDGGPGTDTVEYAFGPGGFLPASICIDLDHGDAPTPSCTSEDAISGMENLIGGGSDDIILGSAGANVIDGGPGDDVIDGGPGADQVLGSAGTDDLSGGGGNDVVDARDAAGEDHLIDGGAGRDTCLVDTSTEYGLATSCESVRTGKFR